MRPPLESAKCHVFGIRIYICLRKDTASSGDELSFATRERGKNVTAIGRSSALTDIHDRHATWHSGDGNRKRPFRFVARHRPSRDDAYRRAENGVTEPVPIRGEARDGDVR